MGIHNGETLSMVIFTSHTFTLHIYHFVIIQLVSSIKSVFAHNVHVNWFQENLRATICGQVQQDSYKKTEKPQKKSPGRNEMQ